MRECQLKSGESRFYAAVRLKELRGGIDELTGTLPVLRRRVEKLLPDKAKAKEAYGELEANRGRLLHLLRESRFCLLEAGEAGLSGYAGQLRAKLAGFNLMTPDYATLVKVMHGFTAGFPAYETVNAAKIGHMMNDVKMGYFPTDDENIGHILKGIAFPEGAVTNLLDPCCGCGSALRKLAMGNNCFTYGIELDEARRAEAQERLHRVAFGSFFHCRVSHEAFHAILLNPPYLSVITEGGSKARGEKKFLIESIPHLIMGGLLIYILPYYRLTPDICRILCDNLTDISICRFTGKEFKKFKQVAVMGIRKEKGDGAELAEKLAEAACMPENIPLVTAIAESRYKIPGVEKRVAIFKGSEFNEPELARQLKNSSSFKSMLSAASKLDGMAKRPPLPLSIGQVGLIGGSGLINGLIDCDYPHLIKGRIVKQRKVTEDPSYSASGRLMSTEIRETVSNKMIFNVLTPNGFRSLT